MRLMVFLSLAATLALSIIVGFQFTQLAKSRADARARNTVTWRAVICSIEAATLKSPDLSADRKRLILKFYDGLLVDDVHTAGCGLTVK